MAAQVFADEELERLRGFPEIGREELARFFSLTPADVAFVGSGRGRGPGDGARLADAAVPVGVRVPDLSAGDPARPGRKGGRSRVVDDDKRRTILARRAEGQSLREIARGVGVSLAVVHGQVKTTENGERT